MREDGAGAAPPVAAHPGARGLPDSLSLAPAMDSPGPPDWAGARWIGSVDLGSLADHPLLELQDSAGFDRARLLVREGQAVRGFVDVDAPSGLVSREVLEAAAAALPPARRQRPLAALPPITVVICTRDRTALLRTSLRAILRLDYPDFDVIVVDNAPSTSQTADMVRAEFDDPRVALVADSVPGLAHARNTGLRHARGDIVAFTDDDVTVESSWLAEIAAGFDQAPDAACVTGLVPAGELRSPVQAYFEDRVNWSRTVTPTTYSLKDPPDDVPRFPFSPGAFGTGANFALRRRAALELGGFDVALGAGTRTGGGEDIDMFTRILLAGHSLVVQPSAVVWHRHRDTLPDLQVQARAYGIGLGAWLAKVFLDPRSARIALARIPRMARSALAHSRQERPPQAPATSADGGSWHAELVKVRRLERRSVALGPIIYLRERRRADRVAHGPRS